jgi:hypothetical protein
VGLAALLLVAKIGDSLSRELLLSLLSFNVGVEAAQLGVIAAVFLPLLLVRRTAARRWVPPALTAAIVLVGLYWFWDRIAVAV